MPGHGDDDIIFICAHLERCVKWEEAAMAADKATQREWARLGARTRLQALEQERSAILKAFPDLRRAPASIASVPGSTRRRFSTAAKRRMSAGMRRYWARRRAEGRMKNKSS